MAVSTEGREDGLFLAALPAGQSLADRRCDRPVGNTVNVADASYTNTIGDPLLTAYWEDPDFDPSQRAFYYVRVLEIPKPSWQAYDAKYYGVQMSDEVPMTVQDRAYTSPLRRARETADLVAPSCGLVVDDALFGAFPAGLVTGQQEVLVACGGRFPQQSL